MQFRGLGNCYSTVQSNYTDAVLFKMLTNPYPVQSTIANAAEVVRIVTEYFRRCKLPELRVCLIMGEFFFSFSLEKKVKGECVTWKIVKPRKGMENWICQCLITCL
ncbi:hypothetical protein FRX31_028689, partial [Thalictrum thalictroides]